MVETQKNIQKIGRLEEAAVLEEKKIYIFFHFPKNIGIMEEVRQKNSQDLAKTLEILEEALEEALEEENYSKF